MFLDSEYFGTMPIFSALDLEGFQSWDGLGQKVEEH